MATHDKPPKEQPSVLECEDCLTPASKLEFSIKKDLVTGRMVCNKCWFHTNPASNH